MTCSCDASPRARLGPTAPQQRSAVFRPAWERADDSPRRLRERPPRVGVDVPPIRIAKPGLRDRMQRRQRRLRRLGAVRDPPLPPRAGQPARRLARVRLPPCRGYPFWLESQPEPTRVDPTDVDVGSNRDDDGALLLDRRVVLPPPRLLAVRLRARRGPRRATTSHSAAAPKTFRRRSRRAWPRFVAQQPTFIRTSRQATCIAFCRWLASTRRALAAWRFGAGSPPSHADAPSGRSRAITAVEARG